MEKIKAGGGYDPDDNINDELTIESMLQVIDTKTGKSLDVRKMLNVKNQDIKDPKLRKEIANYSIVNSAKDDSDAIKDTDDMGEYLSKLNTLEFDMGKFEDDDKLDSPGTED